MGWGWSHALPCTAWQLKPYGKEHCPLGTRIGLQGNVLLPLAKNIYPKYLCTYRIDSSIANFECTLAKPCYTAPNVHFEPRKSGGWFFAVKIWFILSFTSLFPKPNTIILANLNSTFIREYYSWPIIFYWRQSSGSDPMNSSNPVSVDTCFLPATCLLSPNIWL